MKYLEARNGLRYTVNLIQSLRLDLDAYNWFKNYLGKLLAYQHSVNDSGIVLEFTLNVDEEVQKYNFKDVPTKLEVKQYLSILLESDTYVYSDIAYCRRLIEGYIQKEKSKRMEIPYEALSIKEAIKQVKTEVEIDRTMKEEIVILEKLRNQKDGDFNRLLNKIS